MHQFYDYLIQNGKKKFVNHIITLLWIVCLSRKNQTSTAFDDQYPSWNEY